MVAKRILIVCSKTICRSQKVRHTKQLNVSGMTVHQAANHMRNKETLKDGPHIERLQVTKQETIRKNF